MSREREKLRISVVSQVIGSSSTSRRMVVPSGTGRIVWPAVAKPYALSGYTIGQVSWKPLSRVAGWYAGSPSSKEARIPRKPFDSANSVSVCSM